MSAITVKERLNELRSQINLIEESLFVSELVSYDAPIKDLLNYNRQEPGRYGDDFYNTVQSLLNTGIGIIGQYDMPTGIILRLTETVGLQILPDYNRNVNTGIPVTDEDWRCGLHMCFVPVSEQMGDYGKPIKKPDNNWVAGGWEWVKDD